MSVLAFRRPDERERLLRDIERLTVERSKRYQAVEGAKRALLSCGHELQLAYLELTRLAERGRRERKWLDNLSSPDGRAGEG